MNSWIDRSIEMTDGNGAVRRKRFEALCVPLRAELARFAFWLCRDRALADDVVQETLLRAWRSIDSLDEDRAVRAWLLTIARREVARSFERRRLNTVNLESVQETAADSLAVADNHEIEEMRRAILHLELIYREPLVMQVLLGYSTREIAECLEISVAAVLTRLYRAREALRGRLLGAASDEYPKR